MLCVSVFAGAVGSPAGAEEPDGVSIAGPMADTSAESHRRTIPVLPRATDPELLNLLAEGTSRMSAAAVPGVGRAVEELQNHSAEIIDVSPEAAVSAAQQVPVPESALAISRTLGAVRLTNAAGVTTSVGLLVDSFTNDGVTVVRLTKVSIRPSDAAEVEPLGSATIATATDRNVYTVSVEWLGERSSFESPIDANPICEDLFNSCSVAVLGVAALAGVACGVVGLPGGPLAAALAAVCAAGVMFLGYHLGNNCNDYRNTCEAMFVQNIPPIVRMSISCSWDFCGTDIYSLSRNSSVQGGSLFARWVDTVRGALYISSRSLELARTSGPGLVGEEVWEERCGGLGGAVPGCEGIGIDTYNNPSIACTNVVQVELALTYSNGMTAGASADAVKPVGDYRPARIDWPGSTAWCLAN